MEDLQRLRPLDLEQLMFVQESLQILRSSVDQQVMITTLLPNASITDHCCQE